MKHFIFIVVAAFLVGCAASSGKINVVQIGMTKAEVISVMGDPVSVSAKDATEYLNYALAESFSDSYNLRTTPYYVRLINGKVDSYGRTGDFDSTQPTTIKIESEEKVEIDKQADLYTQLRKLEQLRDEGILSDAEYDDLKARAIRDQ